MIVSVPIRKDGIAEGRESLTLKVRNDGKVYERTVFVAASS